ncbi:hypothetical protein [Sorangium sp. So ce764]|uniref:hypothetical protein n=1 Tax=unclassified Sorangium TaxID=2621164 RepID=UPI003F5F1412
MFEAQALTHLRLSDLKLAIIINFGEVRVRQGIHRAVNGLQEWPSSLLHFCAFAPWRLGVKFSGLPPRQLIRLAITALGHLPSRHACWTGCSSPPPSPR